MPAQRGRTTKKKERKTQPEKEPYGILLRMNVIRRIGIVKERVSGREIGEMSDNSRINLHY